MKKIFAPWRIKFILNKKEKKCIFCIKKKIKHDEKNYVIYRSKSSFIILNIYPYNSGHLMIAPYRHIANIEDLSDDELLDILYLIQKSIVALKKLIKPDGFNIGVNLGKTAGAGIAKHLHFHIVPRWMGDTNFMPVVANTKIISESLNETYKKLKEYLK